MGNIGAALPAATVKVTVEGNVSRADIGETLVAIAEALAAALGSDPIAELFAEALCGLADQTKSGVARHASAVLLGRTGGRPRLDVEMFVDEAVDMHKSGSVKTLNKGFLKVARTMPGTASLRSKADLLRKRHLDRKISPAKQV
jgi:hypothetical protein